MHVLNSTCKNWWLCRHGVHLWMPWHKISSGHLQLARQHPLLACRKVTQTSLWKFTGLLCGSWLSPALTMKGKLHLAPKPELQTQCDTFPPTSGVWWENCLIAGIKGKWICHGPQGFSSLLFSFFNFSFYLLDRNRSIKHSTRLQYRTQAVHACFKESRGLGLASAGSAVIPAFFQCCNYCPFCVWTSCQI